MMIIRISRVSDQWRKYRYNITYYDNVSSDKQQLPPLTLSLNTWQWLSGKSKLTNLNPPADRVYCAGIAGKGNIASTKLEHPGCLISSPVHLQHSKAHDRWPSLSEYNLLCILWNKIMYLLEWQIVYVLRRGWFWYFPVCTAKGVINI